MAEPQAPAAQPPAADPGHGAEPNHIGRIFALWLVLSVAADLIIWFAWYPHRLRTLRDGTLVLAAPRGAKWGKDSDYPIRAAMKPTSACGRTSLARHSPPAPSVRIPMTNSLTRLCGTKRAASRMNASTV